ncbi:MAG: hypothetical protein ABIP03_09985, partial [Aquihabitans sp.]
VGLTTSAVQTINDQSGAVIRTIGTGWGGELLEDWTGTNSTWRIYGLNGHHDLTWTAGSTGTVTGTVRYDPWGVATSTTGSVPDFRFQSSWADDTTKLSWVVTRWYAGAQGRFISEDSLTGHHRAITTAAAGKGSVDSDLVPPRRWSRTSTSPAQTPSGIDPSDASLAGPGATPDPRGRRVLSG